jgi:hypothetical protein
VKPERPLATASAGDSPSQGTLIQLELRIKIHWSLKKSYRFAADFLGEIEARRCTFRKFIPAHHRNTIATTRSQSPNWIAPALLNWLANTLSPFGDLDKYVTAGGNYNLPHGTSVTTEPILLHSGRFPGICWLTGMPLHSEAVSPATTLTASKRICNAANRKEIS